MIRLLPHKKDQAPVVGRKPECPACLVGIPTTPVIELAYYNEDKDNAVEVLIIRGQSWIDWWKEVWARAEELHPFKKLALFRKGDTFTVRPLRT